jgi:NAD(P)-dependent dehydrogenase (short-subunit alcohol dehydrogenase family)
MKTIFITGASAGLGKATAKLFHANGWRVVATMRSPEKETELNTLDNVHLLRLDVTDPKSIKNAFEQAIECSSIEVVFNNAGYGLAGPFEAYSNEQIMRQIDTNLTGVLRVAQPFVAYFRENHIPGVFITTTSAAGIVASPMSSVYNATKFALEGWSEGMGYDLSPFGIRFKTVAPGGIKTGFGSTALDFVQNDAYKQLWERMMIGFQNGELIHFSAPEAIAAVVYQAATDGKDQMRYAAGPDAVEAYRKREELGLEGHRREIRQLYYSKA